MSIEQPGSQPAAPPNAMQAPPGGRVAVLLPPSGAEAIRVMALPGRPPPPVMMGRGLDAYRATPIRMAQRIPRAD
ncbi:MAG: hypothetical protein WDN49_24500 [Acetobacteraceae bacterium]